MKRLISVMLSMLIIMSSLIFSASAVESKMKLSGEVYPTFLDVGMSFTLKGTITSDTEITSVTVGVYRKSTGNGVYTKTHTPNSNTYSISSADPYIVFGALSEDNYIYRITASDKNVKNKVLLEKTFVVGFPNGTIGDKMSDVKWNKIIDISEHQYDPWMVKIDWDVLAKNLDAIILRIGYKGYGNYVNYEDSAFEAFYEEASKRNIPIGVYFYSVARNVEEAIGEADFVIKILKKYNCKLSMPVYIDMEHENQWVVGKVMMTKIADAFCKRMLEENYFPGIYAGSYWARDGLTMSALANYTFWCADYNSSVTYKESYEMWQYTENGTMDGISCKVDRNICYKNLIEYIKKNNYNTDGTSNTASYTELDRYISMVPDTLGIYTKATADAVDSALKKAKAVDRNLTKDKQATIDTAAQNLKKALLALVVSGGFERAVNSGTELDDVNQKVYGIPKNTDVANISDYITLNGDAYVEYSNLTSGKISDSTVIYIKINSITIAKYTVSYR